MTGASDGWRVASLRSLLLATQGAPQRTTDSFSYIDIGAIDNRANRITSPKRVKWSEAPSRARYQVKSGDILFSLVRPYLRNVAAVPDDFDGAIASTAFCVLRPGPDVLSSFLFYALLRPSLVARVVTYGHSPPTARDAEFLEIPIPIPPIEDQARLVDELARLRGSLDAACSTLALNARRLVKYRAAILATALRPEATWSHPELRRITSLVTSGSRGWARYYSDAGALFLRVGNLTRSSIKLDLGKVQRVSPPPSAEGTRTRVQPGDVLISITAELGLIAVVPGGVEEAYVNQHIALVRPQANVNPRYLAWYLASPEGQTALRARQRGATKLGLGLDDIRNVVVPLPDRDQQDRIVDGVERKMSAVKALDDNAESSIRRADLLWRQVLEQATSGQLSTA